MDFKTLRVLRSEEGYATLVLDRPDKLNTLSNELRREFVHPVRVGALGATLRCAC
jgi:enoyl-CoA hydratase/carnithine racemase